MQAGWAEIIAYFLSEPKKIVSRSFVVLERPTWKKTNYTSNCTKVEFPPQSNCEYKQCWSVYETCWSVWMVELSLCSARASVWSYFISSLLSPYSVFYFFEWTVLYITGKKLLLSWCTVWLSCHGYGGWSVCIIVTAVIHFMNADPHSHYGLSSEGI